MDKERRKSVEHIIRSELACDIHRHAFPRIFIHDRQQPDRSPTGRRKTLS